MLEHTRASRALELSPGYTEAIKPLYVSFRIPILYKFTSKNSQNLVQTSNKCEILSPSPAMRRGAQETLPKCSEPDGVWVLSTSSKPRSVLSQPRPLLMPSAQETTRRPV